MTGDPLMSFSVFIVAMLFILVFGAMATDYIISKYEKARKTRQRQASVRNTIQYYYNRNMDERKGA